MVESIEVQLNLLPTLQKTNAVSTAKTQILGHFAILLTHTLTHSVSYTHLTLPTKA